MNKIFKVIFNKSTHQLVVVSELGKNKQQDKSWGNLSSRLLKNGVTIAIFGVSTLTLSIQSALAQENAKTSATSANQIDPHLIAGDDPTSDTDSALPGYSITNVLANEVGKDPFIKEPLLNTDIDRYILISPTGQIKVGKMRKGENSFLHHLSQRDGYQDMDSVDLEALKNFLVLGYVKGNSTAAGTHDNAQLWRSTIQIMGSEAQATSTYSSDNITTVYSKDGKDGTIKIQMKENPTFKEITLKNGARGGHTTVNEYGIIIHAPNGGKVSLTEHGLDNGGKVISNVAKGEAPTDAVNKSQLDEAIKDSIIDLTDKGLSFNANSGHSVTNKLGTEVTIRGLGDKNDDQYSGENIKTKVSQDSSGKTIIDIMLDKNLKVDSVRAHDQIIVGANQQNITIKDHGIYIQNGPQLTGGGLDNAGNVISNVADGVNSQDAVTISQLEKVYKTIKEQLDKGLDFSGNTGGYINSPIGSKVEILGDGKNIQTHIEKVSDDTSRVNIQLNDHLHVKDITFQDDPTRGTTTVSQDGISIKSAGGDKSVSLTENGLNNGGNVISNVADGKAPTDAVNVKQLGVLANEVDELKKNIGTNVGKALADIRHQIKETRKESHAGSAAAIASANLPQPFSAGKSMVSAAIGGYHDQQAISVGISRISESGKWIVKSSLTHDTQSNFGAGMGFGYQW